MIDFNLPKTKDFSAKLEPTHKKAHHCYLSYFWIEIRKMAGKKLSFDTFNTELSSVVNSTKVTAKTICLEVHQWDKRWAFCLER